MPQRRTVKMAPDTLRRHAYDLTCSAVWPGSFRLIRKVDSNGCVRPSQRIDYHDALFPRSPRRTAQERLNDVLTKVP